MEAPRVCRICLVANVKMFHLQTQPLETYFENVIGVNLLSTMELPPYICFECAAFVKKFYHFKERCLRGQSTLYELLNCNGKITEQLLQHIDRKNLQLSSDNVIQHFTEPTLHVHENEYSEPYNIKEENDMDCKISIGINSVKEEDYDDFTPLISSDDDEPLSLHKSIKEEKKGKKKDKKIKKDKKKKLDDLDIDEQFENVKSAENMVDQQLLLLEVVPKPKRGRPRKTDPPAEAKERKPRRTKNTGGVLDDDIDLDEYVTIIKLSVEEQLEEINKRQQSSNYQNAPFQCNLCYKGFIDTHAWKHHVGKHDPSAGDIECPICKFRFKTKRTLQKHSANHEKKYACKSCPYVSKTATQAKQHQRWHKGVTYKCQYCDEVSTKWTSYLSHVRIKHPSEFICGVCGYSFVSKLGLTMHKTMMHKDVIEKAEDETASAGPYCQECDVKFISEEAWKRHMVTSVKHTQATHFNNGCRVCGETFKSSEELRLHHRKEHARKRPKNYGKKPTNITWPAKCEHCSEEIPNAREYWTHFRRMHPDKNYPIQKNHICDICGKSFRGNAFLVYHKRTHSEERQFKCGTCGKAFHNPTNLHMHEKTHSDVRPYPCTVCFKAFKCKGALDRHFRCHTGVKPYSCEVCGKSFGQSNSRKLHVRTVHLKQPAPYVSRARLERLERLERRARPRDAHLAF
ncbi:zinc finger protein 354B [Manduca sexta]|uniref:zinc finger protein 354B n=1 Tax=Manduca sexta TaxID=7130 RepID=UPI00188E3269|nr:zinc finger protein 354B [Manduca sexta]